MPVKRRTLRAALFCIIGLLIAPVIAMAQVSIDVQDTVAHPGETNVLLTINMENQVDVCGVQFDLLYPVQWVTPGIATAGSQATNAGWTVGSSLIVGGSLILGFSFTNTPIVAGTGPIASIALTIFSNAPSGDYLVEASNVIISDCLGNGLPRSVTNGVLTITGTGDDDDSSGDDDDTTPSGDDDDTTPSGDDDTTPSGDDDVVAADDDDSGADDDDSGADDDDSEAGDDDSEAEDDDSEDDDDSAEDDDDSDDDDDDDDSANGAADGCACSASPSATGESGAALLLVLIALGFRRKRRGIS